MIFYFTGTGNSLYVAKKIAEKQDELLVSIAKELQKNEKAYEYQLNENETIGFVFPIYAWGPPKIVIEFINKLKISSSNSYTFYISTCGEDEGNTKGIVEKALAKINLSIDSAFSIKMPNNCIIGFDVEPKEVENKKLRNAEVYLEEINNIVLQREKGIFKTLPGKLPALKSKLVNSLFNSFALSTKSFFATDKCNSCGICENICPVKSISVKEKPVWSKKCTQCLACINSCPVHAIQHGKGTLTKGRYMHPEFKNY